MDPRPVPRPGPPRQGPPSPVPAPPVAGSAAVPGAGSTDAPAPRAADVPADVPAVVAALALLDGVGQRPLDEHVEVFDGVHRLLQDALASLDER